MYAKAASQTSRPQRLCLQTGVELDTIAVGSGKDARTVSAREIGSAMRTMWHSYYNGAKSVLVSGCCGMQQAGARPRGRACKLTAARALHNTLSPFRLQYCIDASSSACWAENYADLVELVTHEDLRGKPFAVVLTKW